MTAEQFNILLECQLEDIRMVLGVKANEYASADRLHNFKETARQFGGTPAQACWGFMLKHLTSIGDMAKGLKPVTSEALNEKIGDALNYLILLKAVLIEQHQIQTQG
jgi:hypothetical protein